MLIDRSEICVVLGVMIKALEGFHHQVAKRITEMVATRGAVREWKYPLMVAALESTGLHPIRE